MTVEATEGAAPSAAVVEAPTFTQFDGWDEDGTPVVSKKANAPKPEVAESAAAEETEEKAEAESAKKQETRRKPDAEARIKELTAKAKKLEQELEEARKPKETKPAESSTAKAPENQPAKPAAQQELTRPRPKLDDKTPDGKQRYANYEEYSEDLSDWKVDEKLARREAEKQREKEDAAFKARYDEAKGRHADYESVAKPLFNELTKPGISREVISVLDESPVMLDLLYVMGGTEESKADFLEACRNKPGKALRMILLAEQEIVKELGKSKPAAAATAGEGEGETTPAAANTGTPKPRAPKPPSEVGGRGATAEDALVTAAKSNDFRAFEAEQTRRALAARK